MKRYIAIVLSLVCASYMLAGCGETFHGIGKDMNRIGKGVNTVIFRD
jgi:predicted small secreted protein